MDKPTTQTAPAQALSERARAQLGMLTVMFLLGMAVNLIGLPAENTGGAKTASTIFLTLHGLLGLGLIVNAGLIVRLALKVGSAPFNLARAGVVTVVLTFIAGIITNETKNGWWSFVMATGFAICLPIYGTLYAKTLAAKNK